MKRSKNLVYSSF